nr:hypothetical protein [Leptothoe spongobia]
MAIGSGALSRTLPGWQRRYWEHWIRDEKDFAIHCDYIHSNPVRHGLCEKPQDWEYSSVHRFIAEGVYPPNWGQEESPVCLG